MLDIMKTQSMNECYVCGLLNELEIVEGTTADGRGWIRGTASIVVDQDINGQETESVVSVKMFSMRNKKDGGLNQVYDKILGYRNTFTSVAAAENKSQASWVSIPTAKIEENIWIDPSTGKERSTFQIMGSFMNKKKDSEDEKATFKLSGVVIKTSEEIDKDENPTGRLIIKFGVIGYLGKMNIITLVAEGNAKAHIEENWMEGDTVNVTGRICISQKEEKIVEEQGFGEPIEKTITSSRKELIVTGGSAGCLSEASSYDADSVKKACVERLDRIEKLKEASSKTTKKSSTPEFGF